MPDRSYELHGVRIFECAAEGAPLRNDRDATELISAAWEHRATLAVIPVARLSQNFFRLKTRVAGEILQKFVQYRLRVAIVGDISREVGESESLRDFVYECNRGPDIWFAVNADDLAARLTPPANRWPAHGAADTA
jgi:hypothetical protein